jgi:hypothetical protein
MDLNPSSDEAWFLSIEISNFEEIWTPIGVIFFTVHFGQEWYLWLT